MRTYPQRSRLRITAMVCWGLGGWLLLQLGQFDALTTLPLFSIAKALAGILLLAVGVAFWQLGTDKHAGVIVDSKGIMLNMGHYAAFVAWQNVAAVGVCHQRNSLLALGSRAQLGLTVRDPEKFLQSYEVRLPASQGPLARALRLLQRSLRPLHRGDDLPVRERLLANRNRTGYDLLIPETMLGQDAPAFIERIRTYRRDLRESRTQTRPLSPRALERQPSTISFVVHE
jgi:hypothetical protein